MTRKICALIIALALVMSAAALAESYHIKSKNQSNFGVLLVDLMHAYERPSAGDQQGIEAVLEKIRKVNKNDYVIAKDIVDHWNRVYVNADGTYQLHMYQNDGAASELEGSAIVDSPTHAFVVLGYELENGKMTDELKGRCDAAAAAARAYPNTRLVCSGGPTGKNNPKRNIEAGLMKAYLMKKGGIDGARILIDENAMSTLENAQNTFSILKKKGIRTITVVTSDYHQRWGQVIYNAMAAIYRLKKNYDVTIVENYSFAAPPHEAFAHDDRWAVRQLIRMLHVSDETVEAMKKDF